MPYKISPTLIKKMPQSEQGTAESIGTNLYKTQGGQCSLCDGDMNLAADMLEADHEIPENEGGKTALENLRLAHQSCNRAKKDLSRERIRPYLRLKRFITEQGGRIRYDGVTEHFGITPTNSQIDIKTTEVNVSFSDGTSSSAPILSETVDGREFRYTFIEVPRVAINNDDRVQPRIVRHAHAFSIYNDLLKNPLHEPPSCRLGEQGTDGLRPLLLFDGQHKTIATWMVGRERVAVKVYLDLDEVAANFLVNSIQAKIKKLPLSAFELAAKMSEEFQNKVETYEQEMMEAGTPATEAGFLKWIPAGPDRTRATNAFKDALAQHVLTFGDFRLSNFTDLKGLEGPKTGLTEPMVKDKVVQKLLYTTPLSEPFAESTERRQQEIENITWLVNQVVDRLIDSGNPAESEIQTQAEIKRRLFKQGTLQYISELLGELWGNVMMKTKTEPMIDGIPTDEQRERIEQGLAHLAAHPVWKADLGRDAEMRAVKLALEKNQNIKDSFEGVALDLPYLLLGEKYPIFAKQWRT